MNTLEKRLKKGLFPRPPSSFSSAVDQALVTAGVQKRPAVRALPLAAALSVAAVAALAAILLLSGAFQSGNRPKTVPGNSDGAASPTPEQDISSGWSGSTRVFAFSDPDERISDEDTGSFGRAILSFIRDLGESEPEELWILRARLQESEDGAGNHAYDYLVLAQSRFLEGDGPDLYLISDGPDGRVIWGTQDGSSWPVRVRLGSVGKAQWALFGSNPLTDRKSHITRGVIEGSEPGTDVVFSVYLSSEDSRAPFRNSRYYSQLGEYWLIVIGQEDLDRSLRLESQAGGQTYKVIRKLIPEMQAVSADQIHADPDTLEKSETQAVKTDVLNLSAASEDAAGRYAEAILAWLGQGGTNPDSLWICGTEGISGRQSLASGYVLAMYGFDGETGPELFCLKNGAVIWQTAGYDPFRINTVYDPGKNQLLAFGFCEGSDRDGPAAIEQGLIRLSASGDVSFSPERALVDVLKRLINRPYAEWVRQFFICPCAGDPDISVLSLSFFTADGREFVPASQEENRLAILITAP